MAGQGTLVLFIGIGVIGGLIGGMLKIPGGVMIGAMLSVIALKLYLQSGWVPPRGLVFVLQVVIGIIVGANFHPSMMKLLVKMVMPVIASTLVLVVTGYAISIVFQRLGLLDGKTAYLATSPGAMSVLAGFAVESHLNAPLIVCFHFFRIVFVVLTAPLIFRLLP